MRTLSPSHVRLTALLRYIALAVLGLALLVPAVSPTPVYAEASPEPVAMSEASTDLDTLADYIKGKKSFNDQILQYLELVATAYVNMKGPDAPADDAAEDAKTAFQKETSKFEKDLMGFQKKAEKQIFKALALLKVRKNTNERDDVNMRAAIIIGKLGAAHKGHSKGDPGLKHRASLSKRLIAAVEKMKKAKHDVRPDVLEAAFASLAQLGDIGSLEWMLDEYSHTKEIETDLLVAAHKAMVMFPVTKEEGEKRDRSFVPGKLRLDVIDTFIKSYVSVENAANTSSSDPGIRAKKKFWDNIKNFTIPVMQHFARQPKNDENEALAEMGEFQKWFRKAKKTREYWADPKDPK